MSDECDVCGTDGCYPLRHERLGNESQAMRFARIVSRDHTEIPRAKLLAEWVVTDLTKRKAESKVDAAARRPKNVAEAHRQLYNALGLHDDDRADFSWEDLLKLLRSEMRVLDKMRAIACDLPEDA